MKFAETNSLETSHLDDFDFFLTFVWRLCNPLRVISLCYSMWVGWCVGGCVALAESVLMLRWWRMRRRSELRKWQNFEAKRRASGTRVAENVKNWKRWWRMRRRIWRNGSSDSGCSGDLRTEVEVTADAAKSLTKRVTESGFETKRRASGMGGVEQRVVLVGCFV